MAIYNLYIFNREGQCIYYKEWNRSKQSGLSQELEFKQMFGLIIEMKSFVGKMSPTDLKDGFIGFKTNKYKLNYYETPSGLKFVLNTDLNPIGNPRELLHQLYEHVLLPSVIKNVNSNLQEPIKSTAFENKLDELLKNSSIYKN